MPRRILKKVPNSYVTMQKRSRLFNIFGNIFLVLGVLFVLAAIGPFLQQEAFYYLAQLKNQSFFLVRKDPLQKMPPGEVAVEDSPFARLLSTRPIKLTPVSAEFGLVIEKLGVNVPVVKDVSVTNEDEYMRALERGVAHALVSAYPSEKPGNVYLFAHASLNFWRLGKYATVFNLLRHLAPGDAIHVFYGGSDYVYTVKSVQKYKGFNTYPITRPVLEPLLTLQTCDPPGTTLNRLVVTAKLVEVNRQ